MPTGLRALVLGRSWRSSRALVVVPLALIVAITVVDLFTPPTIHLGPLLIVAPAITASFAGARLTALTGAIAVAALVVIGVFHGGLTTPNHQAQIAALVLISAVVVVMRYLRDRHARQLSQVRAVSEAAQRVLLRPLPQRTGPLRIAAEYLAAEAEARIGGDLYAATPAAHATRLLIGDVRGKGLSAIGDAALLLGAFRSAAHRHIPLHTLVAQLEATMRADPGDLTGDEQGEAAETFVTALILEIDHETPTVRMVNCGHPPLLLLREGSVQPVEVSRPALPLGLGDLSPDSYQVETFSFERGDTLLLYTDGVIETRNGTGAFYPLAERVLAMPASDPEQLAQHVCRDLMWYAGGRLNDDAAVIAVQRTRPPGAAPHPRG